MSKWDFKALKMRIKEGKKYNKKRTIFQSVIYCRWDIIIFISVDPLFDFKFRIEQKLVNRIFFTVNKRIDNISKSKSSNDIHKEIEPHSK